MANSAQKLTQNSSIRIRLRPPVVKPECKPSVPKGSIHAKKKKARSTNRTRIAAKSRFPSRSPFKAGFMWGATISLTALAAAALGGAAALFMPMSGEFSKAISQGEELWGQAFQSLPGGEWHSLLQYKLDRPITLLVMGIDRVLDVPEDSPKAFSGRSDTILLLRFDPSVRSLRLLSIPRDSRVRIPGYGYRKINVANVYGGGELASTVVSSSLNDVTVDGYLRVTTDAFKQLVDLVGGVEVFVPYPMSYRDVTQNLEIDLPAGKQTLNGEQAEQFARFRKDGFGDIGRVQRQQVLLKALQNRVYNPVILARLPQAVKILQQNVDTNLSWSEIIALFNFVRGLEREDIQMVMLPGRFSQPEEYDKSFWLISNSGRDRIMQQFFGLDENSPLQVPPLPSRVRIAIQNSSHELGLANRLREYLAENEYRNTYLLPDSLEKLQKTTIIAQQGDLRSAANLKNLLGLGQVESASIGDLDSDLTIRLGADASSILVTDRFID